MGGANNRAVKVSPCPCRMCRFLANVQDLQDSHFQNLISDSSFSSSSSTVGLVATDCLKILPRIGCNRLFENTASDWLQQIV